MREEEKNVSGNANMGSVTSTSNNGQVGDVSSNINGAQILAGSPGIRIAPVDENPVDATQNHVESVTTTVDKSSTPVVTTAAPMLNPNGVIPKVDISQTTVAPPPPSEPVNPPVVTGKKEKKSKKNTFLIFILLLIIIVLGVYIFLDYQKDATRGECSPLVASDNTLRQLDINSSIVQELYDKVKTNIREDVSYHNFDDTFKLYLAFRQIPKTDFYDSNCNLFNESIMSNFTCSGAVNFVPLAYKEETLQREVRKLFGESVEIANQNIVLGNSCFGGYQYISERGEYVQGYCGEVPTTIYNVDKELISASIQGDTITLREKVRYYSAEGVSSNQLKNGVYVHTFRLDNHYHYAYVNRSIEDA